MKFLTLEIQNFLSIGQASVKLNEQGLVLIEGKNLDDTASKSNGAGKSSIVDALCFALYGKTARGVQGNDVINRSAKKKCFVKLTLEDEHGEKYIIQRNRKNPDSSLTVVKGDQELTKGTMAETQSFVESLIGCPYDVFISVVYAGQDAMPDLPNMSDRQLKELIEKIIGVERISKAYVVALSKVNDANNNVSEMRRGLEIAQNNFEYASNNLARVKMMSEEWLGQRQNELESIKNDYEAVRQKVSVATQQYNEAMEKANDAELRLYDVNERLEEYDETMQKVDKCRQKINQLNTDYQIANRDFQQAEAHVQELSRMLKNVTGLVGLRCTECGKFYREEDIAERKSLVEAQHEEAYKKWVELKEVAVRKYTAFSSSDSQLKEFLSKLKSPTELRARQRELTMIVNDVPAKKYNVDSLTNAANVASVAYKQKLDEINKGNPFVRQIAELEKDIEALKLKIDEHKSGLNQAEKELSVAIKVRDVFGSGGVRQHILETITPVLNARTARYLNILSDGKLKAIWSTLTTTKGGEVREKFNIDVTNEVGGATFDSLSGGEKRKVRLACCFALQELVASRATKPIELFIADEVDHALDESGVERLIGVLNEKARVCKSLFVISHNPLRNWIDNYITIVKEGGVSTIKEG